jgi:hypothetical protein
LRGVRQFPIEEAPKKVAPKPKKDEKRYDDWFMEGEQ